MKRHLLTLVGTVITLAVTPLQAAVPLMTSYQGRVQVGGVNFTGNGQFKFVLITKPGGTSVWSNDGTSANGSEPAAAVTLPVNDGLFTALLGDSALPNMQPLTANIFAANPDVSLRIWFNDGVNGSIQLAPDTRLASVPYAMAANIPEGSITGAQLASAAIDPGKLFSANLPQAGYVLSYDGTGFNWLDLSVENNTWLENGASLYYNGGNVGIGSTTPNHRLRISGGPTWTANGWRGAVELDNAAAVGWRANPGGNRFGIGQSGGGLYFFTTASDPGTPANPANYRMILNDAGNVGIGTIAPGRKLTVSSDFYGIEHTDGVVSLSTYLNSLGGWLGTLSDHKLNFYVSDGGPAMTIDLFENVGIGNPNPATKLDVNGNINYAQLAKLDVADNFVSTVRSADLLLGHSSRRGTPGRALVDFGNSLIVNFGGDWPATVIGGSLETAEAPYVTFRSHDLWLGHSARRGAPGRALVDFGPDLHLNFAGDWGRTVIGGNMTHIDGEASVRALTIRGGADLAEPFEMPETIAKGSVVVIDEEQPGKLKLSTRAYDTRVAGIVSGANGVNPGIALHQEGVLEGGQNVALSGRVYVQADAQRAIKPGDLLTTSDTPGHAMKVLDHTKAQGAILGKAMTGLKSGKGMVLVLVTLQ